MNSIRTFTYISFTYYIYIFKYIFNYIPLRTEFIWNNQRIENMPGSLKYIYKLYNMQY